MKNDAMFAGLLEEIVKNLGHSACQIAATDAEAVARRWRASRT